MLLKLPVEILQAIAREVTERADLKHLCETSTYLYEIAVPILYERVVVSAEDEGWLCNIDVSPLLQTRHTSKKLLHHTKHIKITSKFHDYRSKRCVHELPVFDEEVGLNDESENDEEEWAGHLAFRHLTARLMPLLEGCGDDNLRSFTWALGTCVPPKILGPSGYLSLRQKRISSIHLITDGSCYYHGVEKICPINLAPFKHLTELSWSGFSSREDFGALSDVLNQVSSQLVKLVLDCRFPLGQNPLQGNMSVFPGVRVLSLSNIDLQGVERQVASAFDFALLTSLTLRNCRGWEFFLQHGSRLNKPTKLKTLDIRFDSGQGLNEHTADGAMPQFVESFHGLEQLAICTASPSETLDIWRAAFHHRSTLKAFAHHERLIDTIDQQRAECDSPVLSLAFQDRAKLTGTPSRHPLGELELEFLGLCCTPELLKGILPPLPTNRSLKLLHIRQSGIDIVHHGYPSWGIRDAKADAWNDTRSEEPTRSLHDPKKITQSLQDFAQWAFGSQGLPNLEVLACGDFSYEGRYAHNNILLCRNDAPRQTETFRQLPRDDVRQRELVDKFSDMLAACPTDHLYNN